VADLDPGDAVDGELIKVGDARGAVAGGAREVEAADGDGDVGGGTPFIETVRASPAL
jgi:hypothetical protein